MSLREPALIGGAVVRQADPLTSTVHLLRIFKHDKQGRPVMREVRQESGEKIKFQHYQTCTGVLIRPNVLMTAAHCLYEEKQRIEIEVKNKRGRVRVPQALDFVVHSNSRESRGTDGDIALIALDQDLEDVEIVKVSDSPSLPRTVLAAGYGRTDAFFDKPENEFDGKLRWVELNIDSSIEGKSFRVDQRQGKGVCQGDSGGSALVKSGNTYWTVGVASRVLPRKQEKKPTDPEFLWCDHLAEYLMVSGYSSWIQKNAEKMSKVVSQSEKIIVK
jgi:hypothetical protein